jgi:transcriptional regulator with XRE-family HTH domain
MPLEHSANRLCFLRKQHGLSQKQLAAIVSQDRTMISMYERGKVLPSLAAAGMFQLVFGENIADIFPGLFEGLEKQLAQNHHRLAQHRKVRSEQK